MQLSDQQVEQLFEFTRKKMVHWYDLQVELVDHLASKIEEEMQADPKMDFETALAKVYKEFGLFGFAKVVQEKSNSLHRAAKSLWWSTFKSYFTWPRAGLFLLLSLTFWQLSQMLPMKPLAISFAIGYFIAGMVIIRLIYRQHKMRKPLLMVQVGPSHFSGFFFAYEWPLILGHFNFPPLFFCFYAALGVILQVIAFQLYQRVNGEARASYPEAFA
jgi:hypothetical protein